MAKTPTCGHPNRKVFSNGDCRECAMVKYAVRRQDRLREKRQKEGVKKINPVSSHQAILNKIYKTLAAELKPLHTKCEGDGLIPGCTSKATEIHHAKGRRGLLLILSRYFRYLCKNCHNFCTENSLEAKRIGLSLPINSKTEYEFTNREKELIELNKITFISPKTTSNNIYI